jgi:UDP-3-O-[3-hydroxymyristoyl] glucosamine N-acyltransferase
MYVKRKGSVWASDIAEYLGRDLLGVDKAIFGPSHLGDLESNSIVYLDENIAPSASTMEGKKNILFLTSALLSENDQYAFIVCDDPKRDFVISLNEFFVHVVKHSIHPTAQIAEGAKLGRNVHVGAHAVIGSEVSIGRNTIVMNNVVLSGSVTIGHDCIIKDNAVVGSEGYGFFYNSQNRPIHIPQLGPIIIGDRVWIGSNSSVERSELKKTIIQSDVKIDDQVHIGAGVSIESECMITAGSIVGRNVVLKSGCWLGPGVSILEDIKLENNVMVGQGGVVLHNLDSEGVYVGIPARFLKRRGE